MVDTHCHLDHCADDPSAVISRALAAGVERMATVGMNGDSIAAALELSRDHAAVFAIVGRHPHEAEGFDSQAADEIERAAHESKARAIGETGLDYFRDRAPRDVQRRAFEAQLALARELELPVVIHSRDAAADTFAVLRDQADGLTVVMHCFSTPERLDDCVERGYMCSFAGNVTYPKSTELQAAARAIPDQLLLVETDSPYLAPQPLRGKPNEPANVVCTAEHVAALRGVSYDSLEALVERNAARVFGW